MQEEPDGMPLDLDRSALRGSFLYRLAAEKIVQVLKARRS